MENAHSNEKLNTKVALVTGAGRGYGRAIAEAFAVRGLIVAANDLTPINLDVTVKLISERGGLIKAYLYDVAIAFQAQALVAEVIGDWGRLDVLVNNAGVEPHYPLLDMDEWDWRRTVDVNLSAPFFLTQAAGRFMQKSGGGVIINIGGGDDSTFAYNPSAQKPAGSFARAAFIASKAGLAGLTRAAAQELAADNIHVKLVSPGEVEDVVQQVLHYTGEM